MSVAMWREVRLRARHVVWPVLAVSVLVYVAYHGIHGDRGLIAWRAYQQEVATARDDLAKAEAEREALAQQVMLLHPESVDPDMLDEWARRLLNYGLPDEIVIFTKDDPAKNPAPKHP